MNLDVDRMIKSYTKVVKTMSRDIKFGIVNEINGLISSGLLSSKDDDYLIKMHFFYSIIINGYIKSKTNTENSKIMFNELLSRGHKFVVKQ